MLSIFLKHGEFTDIEKLKDEEKIQIARPIQNRPSLLFHIFTFSIGFTTMS